MIVKWDNGRKSVLITDIPRDLLDASGVTKKYFDRWPMQEKQFRNGKRGVNIHRIVGYGKKIENYDKMGEKHGEICKTITQLKSRLKKPLQEIEVIEEQLAPLYQQERRLREKSVIVEGKRVFGEADSIELKQCEARINKCLRQQKMSFVNLCSLFLTKCMNHEKFE